MSKTKTTEKHNNGDLRLNSRPMTNTEKDRVIEDTKHILPLMYSKEFCWLTELGKEEQFGTISDFIDKCLTDEFFYLYQLRWFLVTLLVSTIISIKDVNFGDDGFVKSFVYNISTKSRKKIKFITKVVNSVSEMGFPQIYNVLMSRTGIWVNLKYFTFQTK